ncbi:MAG: hypothetical protein IH599_07090, partial [Bacteroidales bacterium]|nr:hypothetical protein [Bacteroidales bacterium]
NAGAFLHRVGGDWTNNGATFNPGTGRITLDGSALQTLGGTVANTFNRLTLNNAAGASLGSNLLINDSLVFRNGVIATGTDTVKMGVNADHDGEGAGTYVNGNLLWNLPTGASVQRTFFIGDASVYAPVDIDLSGISTAGTLTGSTTAGDHPSIATSGINAAKSANRYWTMNSSGLVFTDYDAVFNFGAGDVDAGADPLAFLANKLTGTVWTNLSLGTLAATSTQVTGLTSFSDFQLGECAIPAIHNMTGGGTYCPGGTGFNLGLDNSDTLVSYQLYLNDTTAVGAPVPGDDGNPISFGALTDSGTYTVVATHQISSCEEDMAGTAVIALFTPPSASVLTGDTCICLGGTATVYVNITGGLSPYTVVLDTGGGDTTLVGYVSGTGITFTRNTDLTITLDSVADNNGCASLGVSGTASITIDLSSPTFTVPASITIYKGAACSLDADTSITGGVDDAA